MSGGALGSERFFHFNGGMTAAKTPRHGHFSRQVRYGDEVRARLSFTSARAFRVGLVQCDTSVVYRFGGLTV